ncbi:MAG: acetyl/propionyl/methylcrotonyl-CoA carboxylase subunit alpha [Desulfobacteraceae bacterium]|nr:acetyl/propionyl/methylcrotonyl-CoA carboxylase subunit alpha [Desulfobacteraceae bacterium]
MINKILIANRGEIALRIISTARTMGYRTVAVYSEADTGALHVQSADQAVCIGQAPAASSYLSVKNIIHAARLAEADAVHPGYGFLAENAGFARACQENGLVFIGPGADAMELMGSKRLAKQTLVAAGVPCIPGYHGKDQSDKTLVAEAEKIGLPVMIKASAGGGGRGMRLITESGKLAEGIKNARAESQSTFGSEELILEKAIVKPRHIEIQVFADKHGNTVYLGERDCSVQRRHQKVIEEAPSPFVDETLREKMGKAAVDAARACGYLGAGTVEFMVDKDKNFYFLEMNTRLQVEHPVTEMITGLDLIAWQIDIAAGKEIPLAQEEIKLSGHAMEARLYAEDARRSFLPQTGRVLAWKVPQREGVRVDAGIETGREISPHYDPILAKVICHGRDREEARRRLASALQDTVLLGLNNNKLFLERIIRHPVFAAGGATTAFIAQHFIDDISMSDNALSAKTLALAAMLIYQSKSPPAPETDWHTPAPYRYGFKLRCDEKDCEVFLVKKAGLFTCTVLEKEIPLEWAGDQNGTIAFIDQGVRKTAKFMFADEMLYLDDGSGHFIFENRTLETAAASDTEAAGDVTSSMNGVVVEVMVTAGQQVEAGQSLLVIESMKMQHQIAAPADATVESVTVSAGDQVKPGQLLVKLAPQKEEETPGEEK